MEPTIECIVAGGPQHGQVYFRPIEDRDEAPTLVAVDGELCLPAARTHASHDQERLVLLHPQATGEQFLAALRH